MTDLPLPNYTYDPDRHKGKLKRRFPYPTGITGFSVITDWCRIDTDGLVTGSVGYEWDFGTGAIDTISMVVPSLIHDIFCQLTNEGLLPWKVRRKADKFFRKMLKEYGVGFFRRAYCYLFVRLNSIKQGLKR